MRFLLYLVFIVLLGGFAYNAINLVSQSIALKKEYENFSKKLEFLEQERVGLLADLKYYSLDDNLIKELRSQFDYKRPGEKMIKIK